MLFQCIYGKRIAAKSRRVSGFTFATWTTLSELMTLKVMQRAINILNQQDYSPELVLDNVDLPFSIGAAACEGDIDQSVADADAAMYRQKSQRKRARRLIDVAIKVGLLLLAFVLGTTAF
jgi:GGDEF domain-containing protein